MEGTLLRSDHRRDEKGRLNCAAASFLSKGGSTIQFDSSCFNERGGPIGLVLRHMANMRAMERNKDFILTENLIPHSSSRPQHHRIAYIRKTKAETQRALPPIAALAATSLMYASPAPSLRTPYYNRPRGADNQEPVRYLNQEEEFLSTQTASLVSIKAAI